MNRGLAIALWSVLTLALIAFAPGAANAHVGHAGHDAHPHQAVAAKQIAGHHTSLQQQAPDRAAAAIAPASAEVGSLAPDEPPVTAAGACAGACCTAGSCSGHAMAAMTSALGPSRLRSLMLALSSGPSDPGIDPETLPEPPKSSV
ncbi:MAG TPA: hypothetical protein VNR11_15915 [Xanthobacteraceae bacterium]|nr:hypothetical protein [Xanthobacteraceae bacterium]